jgi:hypothetical protein
MFVVLLVRINFYIFVYVMDDFPLIFIALQLILIAPVLLSGIAA